VPHLCNYDCFRVNNRRDVLTASLSALDPKRTSADRRLQAECGADCQGGTEAAFGFGGVCRRRGRWTFTLRKAADYGSLQATNDLTVGAATLAGMAVGAFAVQGLHAQAKPLVYLITEIDVTNPEKYAQEFAPKAQATIKAAGGKFVVIGGTAGVGAKPINSMEGTPPKRITIQAWESVEALQKWYDGADYQEALKIGKQYATFRRYSVEGQQ
jgi:uncharacterized protein (DUF1330 family)